MKTINNIKQKLIKASNIDYNDISKEMAKQQEELKNLENENQDEVKQLTKKNQDISSIRHEIEILLKKIINIPKNFDKNGANNLKKEIDIIKDRIIIIDKIFQKVSNNDLSEKIDRINELKEKMVS